MIVVATNDIIHCQTYCEHCLGGPAELVSGGSSDTDFTGVRVIEEGTLSGSFTV